MLFHAEFKHGQRREQLFGVLASCNVVYRERSSLFSLELGFLGYFHLRSRSIFMFSSCFLHNFLFLLLYSS
ncbi:uncharacterized protein DS421_12g365120 [Arachis hypogaea]|nr:uncharacterized protein DS421_12g365120 [Arachis hypogaea]